MKSTDEIIFKGRRIKVYLYYNWVLDYFDVLKRTDLDDISKLDIALRLFVRNSVVLKKLSVEEKIDLCRMIQNQLIDLNKRKGKVGPRVVDFRHDFELLTAGFQQAYSINLYEQRNKMSWKDFYSLFIGLPADTKICEVISIRARELPAPTKYNAKERQSLMEAKQYWALPADGNLQNNYQSELNSIFDTMLKMCGR